MSGSAGEVFPGNRDIDSNNSSERKSQNVFYATALRKVLNEQSIHAAYRLLKKPSGIRDQILALIASGEATNTKEAEKLVEKRYGNKITEQSSSPSPQWRSCWNCHHRGETIDNQSATRF